MKAIGFTYCSVCGLVNRGYAPRGWKPGEQLASWRHTTGRSIGEQVIRCPGSYKRGTDSTLDDKEGQQ